ncbi:hypothetical protein [Halosegnis marinus]|uniref:Uncharacterized protein n=1 Tax=Halosegnis marinus TaxID=3034023 RepID=A0ABD5ZKC5_9EURY|nr:hypothetical protein [Halosegnis sp. DT85]
MRVPVSDRLREAASDWGEQRLQSADEALETKVEQALLEVEHLASGATDVEFELDGDEIRFEPSRELSRLLSEQADEAGIGPDEVLVMYVDLCARVFVSDDDERPANAPPTDLDLG